MATHKQLKLIHLARRELEVNHGFTDPLYRDLLYHNFGVESSKDLQVRQVSELLKHFEDLGWKGGGAGQRPRAACNTQRSRPRPPADPDGLIENSQQNVIMGLRDFIGWAPQKFRAFCVKRFKSPWPQNHRDGQKVIYALISIGAEQLCREIWNLRHAKLTPWERGFLYENPKSAEKELERFYSAKGKRGFRKMPEVSMTKLLEIINKRGDAR